MNNRPIQFSIALTVFLSLFASSLAVAAPHSTFTAEDVEKAYQNCVGYLA